MLFSNCIFPITVKRIFKPFLKHVWNSLNEFNFEISIKFHVWSIWSIENWISNEIRSQKILSIINLRHAYNLRIKRKDERLTTIVVENFLTKLTRSYCVFSILLFTTIWIAFISTMQSCTKVAVDFVSPENIRECLRLTEEFRQLPVNHRAREDKLEVTSFLIQIYYASITLF